jgi:hypothetical protein
MVKLLSCSTLALAAAFARFWAAYPKRRPNPKALAEHEFAKLAGEGVDPERLVAAAAAFAAECTRLGTQAAFVPHARTFLAQRRFSDYLEPLAGRHFASMDDVTPPPSELKGDPRLRGLALEMSQAKYDTWIAPLALEARGCGVAVIAPTAMHRDWVRNHYGDLLRRTLGMALAYEIAGKRSDGHDRG